MRPEAGWHIIRNSPTRWPRTGERGRSPAVRYRAFAIGAAAVDRSARVPSTLGWPEVDRHETVTDALPAPTSARSTSAVAAHRAGRVEQLYAATAPGVDGGRFLGPGGPTGMRGHPVLIPRPAEGPMTPRSTEYAR
jgi:hypothetical protein